MKKKYITKLMIAACLSSALSLNSCIEEVFPESSTATIDQIGKSDQAISAMVNSVVAFINAFRSYGPQFYHDFGYSGYNLIRESACEDFFCHEPKFDFFDTYGVCNDLGDADVVNTIWYYNYKFLNNVNNALSALEKADDAPENKYYKGICLSYRAMIYMDLVRMYEYKKTGVEKLDAEAASKNLYGITVPIITDETTEEEGRNNPRAPFYAVYKFILDDLASAEELLSDYQRPTKNLPCTPVVHGLMARMWLEMGSRFELYPEDLNTLNNNTDLNIASKETCFTKAAEYARKVINESGAMPLTEKEWFGGDSYTTGFNSVLTNSWVWGSIMTTEDVHSYWLNFAGSMCPEQTFGYGNRKWQGYKLIGKKLFDQIPNADWRKTTWIAPEDAGKAPGTKYHTLFTDENFKKVPAYVHLKFKPKEGNMIDANVGAPIDNLLMRVEEMYLIKAEAEAMGGNLSGGKSTLENFVRTYRDPSFTSKANSAQDFQDEVWLQRRMELWGEGFSLFDILRLKKPVIRKNTNYDPSVQYNSAAEAQILIYRIPQCEMETNSGISDTDNNPAAPQPQL